MKVEESFQDKIRRLQPWFPLLIEDIKKDVKTELIRQHPKIFQRHFSKMHFAKCSPKELAPPLLQEVLSGDESLGEWLASRWVVKNSDIYNFFAQRLMQITPDFDKIELLDEGIGEPLMREAVQRFGAERTYLFSVLNSVAFSSTVFERLAALATEAASRG